MKYRGSGHGRPVAFAAEALPVQHFNRHEQ